MKVKLQSDWSLAFKIERVSYCSSGTLYEYSNRSRADLIRQYVASD